MHENEVGTPFPELTVRDTYRKGVAAGRQVGDSRRDNGMLWTLGAIGTSLPVSSSLGVHDIGTQSGESDMLS